MTGRREAVAFTDGACLGNPGPGGWGAILRLPGGRVRELGGREARTTNNRMELKAAIEVLRAAPAGTPLVVHTDSSYVIGGASRWLASWKRRGWRKPDGAEVLNRDLWTELDGLLGRGGLSWRHVRGHSGVPANARADAIAVSFAEGRPEHLYEGPAAAYPHGIEESLADAGVRPGPPTAPYLSLVGGRLERHATWAECEARVKGHRGVRFKKVRSRQEEAATLRSWGVA